MSSKNILPNEMLAKILAAAHYEDREAIELSCKHIRNVAISNETRMKHKIYRLFCIRLFEENDKKDHVSEETIFASFCFQLHNDAECNAYRKIRSKEDFLANMRKVELTDNSGVIIEFTSHSQNLLDIVDVLKKTNKQINIVFNHDGLEPYQYFNLLCNNWTGALKRLVIRDAYGSFNLFAEDTSIKLRDNIVLDYWSYGGEGNIDIDVWDNYLSNHNFNSIEFGCGDTMSTDEMYSFIVMLFKHIAANRLGSIKVTVFAEFGMHGIRAINQRIRLAGFNAIESNSHGYIFGHYSNGMDMIENNGHIESQIEFELNY
uniref:F-box domain-containing protein n=1 Tax=Rhabditophanes sp. KR3021 TaxID=114890 RepID=A0AC35UAY8_9BILA